MPDFRLRRDYRLYATPVIEALVFAEAFASERPCLPLLRYCFAPLPPRSRLRHDACRCLLMPLPR
jgi:hypothetical protein